MNQKAIAAAVRASLLEDMGEDISKGDITATLLPKDQMAHAVIVTNEPGILCGRPWVEAVYQQINTAIKIHWAVAEGEQIFPQQKLAEITGPARSLVTGERAALNWLQTLSGTATIVASYVAALQGTRARLRDTRKTIPGLRYAQKYAVLCGGGTNHRMGLYDAYLIKENHIISCGSLEAAIQAARAQHPDYPMQIEVENLTELQQALTAGAKHILLDNFAMADIAEAVRLNKTGASPALLEVSGNVHLNNIRAIANTGVDFIAVGAITKHVRAIDLAMRFLTTGGPTP